MIIMALTLTHGRYKEAGPIFVVFFIVRVMVVTLNPNDVKVVPSAAVYVLSFCFMIFNTVTLL